MSLAFLGLDDDLGACPHCGGRDSLIYTSFSKNPVSCDSCLWAKKAAGEPLPAWAKQKEEEHAAHSRAKDEVRKMALEWGRQRVERMKK